MKERDKKMMNREEMLDKMIRSRGFEDKYVIQFAEMMEDPKFSDYMLLGYFIAVDNLPLDAE